MATPKLDLIFEQWKASLHGRKRSKEYVASNFEELFDSFNTSGASFEEAHAYLDKAIKVHLPPQSLAKMYWKNARNNPLNDEMTEKEFIESWNKSIADKATTSFYNVFPIPEEKDEDPEPKVYGSMSAKEYKAQRRNAELYPILDTEELERRLQSGLCNPEDLLDKDSDGKS